MMALMTATLDRTYGSLSAISERSLEPPEPKPTPWDDCSEYEQMEARGELEDLYNRLEIEAGHQQWLEDVWQNGEQLPEALWNYPLGKTPDDGHLFCGSLGHRRFEMIVTFPSPLKVTEHEATMEVGEEFGMTDYRYIRKTDSWEYTFVIEVKA